LLIRSSLDRSSAKQGQAQIIAIVRQMHLQEAMDDFKKHDE